MCPDVKPREEKRRPRILFVSESVTLAQVVRLLVLARGLDPGRFEVHFAASTPDDALFEDVAFPRWRMEGVDPAAALRAAGQGRLPSLRTLRRQVAEDLALFERIRPDVVVGDLRLSLSTSAPVAGVPFLNLINAYWSPLRAPPELPLPEHPLVRLFGVKVAERHFQRAAPTAMRLAARPLNALRREHGLLELGDLPSALTFGDRTLFPDAPELTPLRAVSRDQIFLGPVLWAPRAELPRWWGELGRLPLVYVTLGSSGDLSVLPTVLAALESLPVEVMVSTAGRLDPARLGPKVHAASMLPGDRAARRASLVITNGGSSTGYQALYEGRPVVGLPSNLDQYLAMSAIERAGAGVLVRSGTATRASVTDAVKRVLEDTSYAEAAEAAAHALRSLNPHERFAGVLEEVTRRDQRVEAPRC